MVMRNNMDRYHLVIDVIDRVPTLGSTAAAVRQDMVDRRVEHLRYVVEHGDDLPEIRDWQWTTR
jgi:xylulose-5-phosphate/fructose-6-phosphate phosphoketolase